MNVACSSAISRQHITPHRLHLHQLLTDETTDLDSYEVPTVSYNNHHHHHHHGLLAMYI